MLTKLNPVKKQKKSAGRWWLTPVNPGDSGGSDKDHGSKTAQANSSWDPLKNTHLKKVGGGEGTGGVAQGVGPEFKP
jgi:hypothetical protein